jgi:hypothetical protein
MNPLSNTQKFDLGTSESHFENETSNPETHFENEISKENLNPEQENKRSILLLKRFQFLLFRCSLNN